MMNKIIPKIYIVILAVFVALPSFALANGSDVETTNATSVTSTSAKLNGIVSFEKGTGSVWFEYGKSNKLENKTSVKEIDPAENIEISKTINFDSTGTYYFRICFNSTAYYGTDCGNVERFNNQPTPVVANTSTSTNSSNSTSGSSTNSSSSSSSSTSSTKSNSTKSNTVKDSTESNNSQSASVAGATNDGNFLPDTFLEWIVVIALIFIIVMFGRYLYVKRQEEKEEEKRKQMEAQLRFQNA